ncbi:hypothetical protein ACJX0J_006832, partial [Zea mays]
SVGRIDSVRVRLAMVNKSKGISLPRHAVLHVVHPQRPLLRRSHAPVAKKAKVATYRCPFCV